MAEDMATISANKGGVLSVSSLAVSHKPPAVLLQPSRKEKEKVFQSTKAALLAVQHRAVLRLAAVLIHCPFKGGYMESQAKVVQLKTQLVKEGHTRRLLAETDLMTLRIHCYAPGIGENALHSHTKEDHIFLVLQGTAQFNTGRDGKTVISAGKNQAVVLPAGCYYQFCNSGQRSAGHGAHRRGTRQGRPTTQPGRYGNTRENSRAGCGETGADRRSFL
jgi:mannose-6-phosphate isomerase-like protein (cupin superfamily)